MSVPPRSERLARVRAALAAEHADALIVPASADFRWLTGAPARVTERLVALVLPRDGAPWCIVPRLEAHALGEAAPGLELEIWDETDDPLARLSARLGVARKPALLLGEGFRTHVLLALAAQAPCRSAATALAPLRAVKDAAEIAAMEAAARNADGIMRETAEELRPGVTERQVQRAILERFEALGDHDAWAIVASGPNGASPHHFTSDRTLRDGDVVILDLGAYHDGYGSDITRTYWLGEPPAEAERVYAVVDEARRAGIAAARAGVACGDVDAAAREVIVRAGYGEYFTHRTGHGVGLEVHEPPYIVGGNRERLAVGMTHSVEPGIYLPGRFGVRLEDLVVVEAERARRLNDAPFAPALAPARG